MITLTAHITIAIASRCEVVCSIFMDADERFVLVMLVISEFLVLIKFQLGGGMFKKLVICNILTNQNGTLKRLMLPKRKEYVSEEE